MKRIPLTQRKFALVDDEDFEWLNRWKWFARETRELWYAGRFEFENKKRKQIHMHRLIMKTPSYLDVDHIDRNGLNNQKYNLRNCTRSQNQKNRKKQDNNTSGFMGVSWDKSRNKYKAKIKLNGKTINLGRFQQALDAAKVYDQAAIKYHKEFATLNFPRDNYK